MSWDIGMRTMLDGQGIDFGREFNYTHNTNPMIREAGFAEWPDVDGMNVGAFCERLHDAIGVMRSDPVRFRAMNPKNGWGDYDRLLTVLDRMLDEFQPYPSARIWACI